MNKYKILKAVKDKTLGFWYDKIIAEVGTKYEAEKLVSELRQASGSQLYSYEKGTY